MAGIITTKLEMTRVVAGERFVPVTLLQVPELKVVGFKTEEKDGYNAIIVGVIEDVSKSELGEGKTTLNKNAFSCLKEFPLNDGDLDKYKIGDSITIESIGEDVMKVTIEGMSKGKGFAGAMKRHNFHGGPAGHGSKFHRALGSIGNRKPRRTHAGKKMHGHMGNEKFTIKNVPVMLVNKELNIIGVKGGVPGGRHSNVFITF